MILPQRALYILAEYCGIRVKAKTCRARTEACTICKHKRTRGKLFCVQHTAAQDEGSMPKFLFSFACIVKSEKLTYKKVARKLRFGSARYLTVVAHDGITVKSQWHGKQFDMTMTETIQQGVSRWYYELN